MKKTVLAISMLCAIGSASAQSSSVTLYGTVDGGISSVHGQSVDGRITGVASGQEAYSRFGFRGNEDLGGGTQAFFVLEQGIFLNDGELGLTDGNYNLDDANNTGVFNSQSYAGLGGSWGKVKFGRQLTPLYQAYGAIDPFMNGFAANINNFFGTDVHNYSNYQRINSAAIFETPDLLGGFKIAAAYGFGGVAGSLTENAQAGASISYINGPVSIAYAYHQANDVHDEILLGAPVATFKTNFLGAAFDFGPAKLHVALDQNEQGSLLKTQDYLVGVTVPIGANELFADYLHKKNKLIDNADADQYAIGYTHNLSKRTNLYIAYTQLKNQANSSINTELAGNTVETVQAGIRHMF